MAGQAGSACLEIQNFPPSVLCRCHVISKLLTSIRAEIRGHCRGFVPVSYTCVEIIGCGHVNIYNTSTCNDDISIIRMM